MNTDFCFQHFSFSFLFCCSSFDADYFPAHNRVTPTITSHIKIWKKEFDGFFIVEMNPRRKIDINQFAGRIAADFLP
jgi:hypothetical protein